VLFEPSTLTSVARLIAETLETQYGQNAAEVFRSVGLDPDQLSVAGARYPWKKMPLVWEAAAEATGDPCFGLRVGKSIRPTSFHALGYSWLASRTLMESLERLSRYHHIISTAPIELTLETEGASCVLTESFKRSKEEAALPAMYRVMAADAFFMAIVELCRTASNKHFSPLSVTLTHEDFDRAGDYISAFGAPVIFRAERNALFFDLKKMEAPLPGDNIDLATANDKVTEHYLASLDPRTVATEVRELLIELLPSGTINQTDIARRMNRSLSTLQRQLNVEGTTYQELRDDTRRHLAEDYVQEKRLALSQIAYLLGFSDQSNFSRAFKRWTGQSPRDFRE